MTDLMYFGDDLGSPGLYREFNEEITKAFPSAVLEDAYDPIKGWRYAVTLDDDKSDAYWSWVIAHGWFSCSLSLQLLSRDSIKEFERLFKLAKVQYPHMFKKP